MIIEGEMPSTTPLKWSSLALTTPREVTGVKIQARVETYLGQLLKKRALDLLPL